MSKTNLCRHLFPILLAFLATCVIMVYFTHPSTFFPNPSTFDFSEQTMLNDKVSLSCGVSSSWKESSKLKIEEPIAVVGESLSCDIKILGNLENYTIEISLINSKIEREYTIANDSSYFKKHKGSFEIPLITSDEHWFSVKATMKFKSEDEKTTNTTKEKSGVRIVDGENKTHQIDVDISQPFVISTGMKGEVKKSEVLGPQDAGFFYVYKTPIDYYNEKEIAQRRQREFLLMGFLAIFSFIFTIFEYIWSKYSKDIWPIILTIRDYVMDLIGER